MMKREHHYMVYTKKYSFDYDEELLGTAVPEHLESKGMAVYYPE